MVLPELADTLRHIGDTGAAAMEPDGWLAREIVDGLERLGGLVTREDIAAYRVIQREPVRLDYRDVTLHTNPPPSSGGILIAAALAHLAGRPAPADEAAHYLGVTAAGAAANALRDEAFATQLHDPEYVARLWRRIRDGEPAPGAPASRAPTGTTHVSVMDAEGGVAAVSSSNGAGSGVMLPGLGFLLNNMLGEEDLNPGGFGRIPAGRRMTSMMAPTLVERGGRPLVVLGSAGSNRLRSAITQTIVSIVDGGMGVHDAVARPRVHPEGDGVDVEGGVPEDVCVRLTGAGYRLRRWGGMNLFFGGVGAVGTIGGDLWGAGDPRRGGAAAGVTSDGEVVDLSTRS
ncbi:MAG: gamma-glutamyltransferase [Thermoleophilia bacterium]